MKAEMNERGVIVLTPETNVEAYALRKWCNEALVTTDDLMRGEQCYWRGSCLIVESSQSA